MKKVRCLIVDDEELMIQRLTLFFEDLLTNGSPFELVGKAFSGDEGLELAERLKPDIVITDIVMPGMDGITMIEQMKRTLPDTEFIILTAYSDFNYAMRAIRFDVSDYIVKVPLNENDLLQAMNKAAANLIIANNNNEKLRKLNMSILENRHRIFKQFFRELFRGEIMTKQAEEITSSFDMKLFHGDYCCMVIEMNGYVDFINKYPLSDQSILKYAILNVIEETLQLSGGGFACEIEENRFIGFLQWPNLHSEMMNEKWYLEVGQTIIRNLRTYLKQSVAIGFSLPRKGWSEITSAYMQALEACEDQYYLGPESIVTSSGRVVREEGNTQAIRNMLQEILQFLHREVDFGEIQTALGLIKEQANKERVSRQLLTSIFREFLLAASNKISGWKQEMARADEDSLYFMSLSEQMAFIAGYIETCLLVEGIPERPEIARAIEYIERNLTDRLTLQNIAEQANLAPAYFSSLFKKVMKVSLVDYINRKKIDLAIELIKNNRYSNQELCEMVGIMNEAYFCTLFKQKTGSSPGQYRKKKMYRK